MAKIIKKSEFIGVGALIQLSGLILFILSFALGSIGAVFGFFVMLGFFAWGSRKAQKFYCSNCNNPVDNKHVKLCSACKAEF